MVGLGKPTRGNLSETLITEGIFMAAILVKRQANLLPEQKTTFFFFFF